MNRSISYQESYYVRFQTVSDKVIYEFQAYIHQLFYITSYSAKTLIQLIQITLYNCK